MNKSTTQTINTKEAYARYLHVINQELKKGGLRGRINAKCVECIFDPLSGDGNWRQQVGLCTSKNCPLFEVRPVSKPHTGHPKQHSHKSVTGDTANG